jgi:hypothetical protein
MEIRLQKDGPVVGSPGEITNGFSADLLASQVDWQRRLAQDPKSLRSIQREMREQFRHGRELLTAALLATATQQPVMADHVQRLRQQSVVPLRSPGKQRRPLKLRIGALVVWASVLYCPPQRRKKDAPPERRAGLYPELAALGIRNGDCPEIQDLVARTVALCPSIEAARKELRRLGYKLNKKTVRRIAETVGKEFLARRCRELLAWRAEAGPAGKELAGCRVAVQIDGGRLRTRKNKPGPRQKGQRRKFKTPWREPKVLVIYAFNKQGRREEKRVPLIDGTLQGPDHLAELAAFHLHRLGAAQAEVVVFLSDGAPWIWDRLDWIIARAGLKPSQTVRVLDWYHAVQHVHRALTLLKLSARERRKNFVKLRTLLKQSRHAAVVSTLRRLAKGRTKKHKVWTEIRYLQKHGEAGHLQYLTCKRRGLPIGSGAVESTIRRVINLRLKSNAMYWLEENAEALFAVRASLLSDRWETALEAVSESMSHDARLVWQWDAPKLSDAPLPSSPAASQLPTPQAIEGIAA